MLHRPVADGRRRALVGGGRCHNVGAAGIFAPPDLGMPADGVVALGEMDTPGWTYADLDLDALAELRRSGAVRGRRIRGEQPQSPPLRLQIR